MSAVRKALLGSTAILASFLVAGEIGLRRFGFSYPAARERGVIWSRTADPELRAGTGLHEVDQNGMWRPRPGAAIPWAAGESVNAAGMRGPAVELAKRPGVLRIATLGDAGTFGRDVAWQDTWSAQLVEILRARGVPAEVVCAGVIDSTSRQGLELYRDAVRPYRPDLVVCAYDGKSDLREAPQTCCDDARILRLCGPFRATAEERAPARFVELREGLRLAHVGGWLADIREGSYWRERFDTLNEQRLAGRADTFDVAGVRRVSYVEFLNTLITLAREAAADGAHTLLLQVPSHASMSATSPVLELYVGMLSDVASSERLVLVDGRKAILESWHARFPIDAFFHGDVPSECGHAVLANALADEIVPRLEEYLR